MKIRKNYYTGATMIILESKSLLVELVQDKQQIRVTDKRIEKEWLQKSFPDSIKLEKIEQNGDKCRLSFAGEIEFIVEMTLEEDTELVYTLKAQADTYMKELRFPPATMAPDMQHYILQTDSNGLLLSVDDCHYPLEQHPFFFCGGGIIMSWIGVVDYSLESGFMNLYETPYDTAIDMKKVDGQICFSTVWLSSKESFAYERKMRTIFFDKGGYVAQCKRYRKYAWPKNNVTTLKSRLSRFPKMENMLGAVHVYVWDDARNIEFAKDMKDAGVEKALILWNPNHQPYPNTDFDAELKKINYGTGAYETFTDTHPENQERLEKMKKVPLARGSYPGLFDFITAKKKDGTTYSNRYATYVCPAAVPEEMKKRIEKELKVYEHETYFLDVYQANGLYECYDERHPITREGYAQCILNNSKFIEDNYGLYLGGEMGADFGAAHGAYVHGMMTLQRTWWADADIEHKGCIYDIGDWKDPQRPSIMLGSRTATPAYHKYGINEYTRVPLYELVYHDAVVTSWRWEDGNHHYPELWWKKDLFNVLYGSSPLWSLDRNRWESFKDTFLESYRHVCPWVQQVCCEEMLNHRFVTLDRMVQETVFSSGKKAVVNFGEKEYNYNGTVIPARDYVTF